MKRGRAFTERDTAQSPPVVVINEAMAKQFWPKGDPLSDRLVIGRGVMREFADEPERQIIGIVANVRDGGLNNDPQPTMYIPQAQVPDPVNALNVQITPMAWVVRTRTDPYAPERRDPGDAAAGDGPARVGGPHAGRGDDALDVAAAVQHVADDRVRHGRAGAGGDRHLRPDGVLGGAAHAGDRHPPRARREGRRR